MEKIDRLTSYYEKEGEKIDQNTEKINEIIDWINGMQEVANKPLKGH